MDKKKQQVKPSNLKKTLLRLIRYYKQERLLFAGGIFLIILATLAQVAATSMMRPTIDAVTVYKDLGLLKENILMMVGLVLVIVVAQYLGGLWMAKLAQRIMHRIRKQLFDQVQDMPISYYETMGHGRIMSTFTNDVDLLTQALEQSSVQVITSIVTVIGSLVMMLRISVLLTVVLLVILLASMFLVKQVAMKSSRNFRRRQEAMAEMNSYTEELISAQKVVKVFNYEDRNQAAYGKINQELGEASYLASAYGVMMMPLMGNLSFVQYAIIAVIGSSKVMSGNLSIGSLAAFLQYSRTISRPITMVSNQMNSILSAIAGAERIFEIMDTPPEEVAGEVTLIGQCHGPKELCWQEGDQKTPVYGDVRLSNVDFSYVPGKPVLKDVSIFAKPGQKIALVGSTGAGKTTITNLINRFYEIDNGSITIDGIDISRINKIDLRSIMSVVLQDVHLFEGTIADNIRFGRLDASDEEVVAAAKLANAHDFILRLKDGYHTQLGSDAVSLSQGERQLLSIARAAIADPVILILDEATSSVDTRTEALIEKAMDELMKGRTTFVIAHRLSTVRHANAIIVLEHGQIVERGDHDDLMAQKGRYYRLNMGTEELA